MGNESEINLRFAVTESREQHFYNNDRIDGRGVKKHRVKLSEGKFLLLHPSLNGLFLTPFAE